MPSPDPSETTRDTPSDSSGAPLIHRARHLAAVERLLAEFPVVGLIGARQVGKTTLAQQLAANRAGAIHRFDLEDPRDAALLDDADLALRPLSGLVVLDEVQRVPDLFPLLRVLADRRPLPARFLVLGSASPSLLRQSSESLAGRIGYYELPGLDPTETAGVPPERHWLRGGFPRALLAADDAAAFRWLAQFAGTFVERDLAALGIPTSPRTLDRFWGMLAHWHGQVWNAAEFGRAFGVSDTTARRYLDQLTAALVVRQLKPWFANVGKREVRSPKVYLRDSGVLHHLLGVGSGESLLRHPKCGASWEGWVLEQLATLLEVEPRQLFFWGLHTGAELDLVVHRDGRLTGYEIKRSSAPKMTRSIHSALDLLDPTEVVVVHAGERAYPLADRVRAVPAPRLFAELSGGSGSGHKRNTDPEGI